MLNVKFQMFPLRGISRRETKIRKIISGVLIAAMVLLTAGSLAVPRNSRAFEEPPGTGSSDPTDWGNLFGGLLSSFTSPNVPVQVEGGDLGNLQSLSLDWTALALGITGDEAEAANNAAFQTLGTQWTTDLENQLAITNPMYYADALVENKYLADTWSKMYGQDAVPTSTLGDISAIAGNYELLPLNTTMTAKQAAAMGATQSKNAALNPLVKQQQQRDINRLIVGATSLLTSSISCAGVNTAALKNTAAYLASSSAGILTKQVNTKTIQFYNDMFKLSQPTSNENYWMMQFQDNAASSEATARAAANLEMTSPGIKSPQTQNAAGQTSIAKSLNLLTQTQTQVLNSAITAATRGGNVKLAAGGMASFATLLLALYTEGKIMGQASKAGGNIFSTIIGKIFGGLGASGRSLAVARSYGKLVGQQVAATFAKALFEKLIGVVFKGKILGESSRCRGTQQYKEFKSGGGAVVTPPGNNEQTVNLYALPMSAPRGETAFPVNLFWTITGYSNPTVSIDKIGDTTFNNLEATTTLADVINTTDRNSSGMVYKLVVNRGRIDERTSTQTVVYENGERTTDFSGVTFSAEPTSASATSTVDINVTWDARSAVGTVVTITPLRTDGSSLAAFGTEVYKAAETTKFTMLVVNPTTGESATREVTVTITKISNPFALRASPETVRVGTDSLTLTVSGAPAGSDGAAAQLWFNVGSGWVADANPFCTIANGTCSKTYPASTFNSSEIGKTYDYYVKVSGETSDSTAVTFVSASAAPLAPRQ
ncbi:hypothetical protein D4R52_01155 [bacterium]|nr:MAG: hypothetical protein D4R52_01155 [bacterium]